MLSPRQKDHYAGVKRNGSGSSAATPRFLESDPQSSDDEEVELQSRIKNVEAAAAGAELCVKGAAGLVGALAKCQTHAHALEQQLAAEASRLGMKTHAAGPLRATLGHVTPLETAVQAQLRALEYAMEDHRQVNLHVAEFKRMKAECDRYSTKVKGMRASTDKMASNARKLSDANFHYENKKRMMRSVLASGKAKSTLATTMAHVFLAEAMGAEAARAVVQDIVSAPPEWLLAAMEDAPALAQQLQSLRDPAHANSQADQRLAHSQDELRKANETIHALNKEMDVLKASMARDDGEVASSGDVRQRLESAWKKAEEATAQRIKAEKQREEMQNQLQLAAQKVQVISEGFMVKIRELEMERNDLARQLASQAAEDSAAASPMSGRPNNPSLNSSPGTNDASFAKANGGTMTLGFSPGSVRAGTAHCSPRQSAATSIAHLDSLIHQQKADSPSKPQPPPSPSPEEKTSVQDLVQLFTSEPMPKPPSSSSGTRAATSSPKPPFSSSGPQPVVPPNQSPVPPVRMLNPLFSHMPDPVQPQHNNPFDSSFGSPVAAPFTATTASTQPREFHRQGSIAKSNESFASGAKHSDAINIPNSMPRTQVVAEDPFYTPPSSPTNIASQFLVADVQTLSDGTGFVSSSGRPASVGNFVPAPWGNPGQPSGNDPFADFAARHNLPSTHKPTSVLKNNAASSQDQSGIELLQTTTPTQNPFDPPPTQQASSYQPPPAPASREGYPLLEHSPLQMVAPHTAASNILQTQQKIANKQHSQAKVPYKSLAAFAPTNPFEQPPQPAAKSEAHHMCTALEDPFDALFI